jgi:hypothetical protein
MPPGVFRRNWIIAAIARLVLNYNINVRGLLIGAMMLATTRALVAQNVADGTLYTSTRLVVVPALVQNSAKEIVYSLQRVTFCSPIKVPLKGSLSMKLASSPSRSLY